MHNGIGNTDVLMLILRIVVGTFFAISGWHKLFNRMRHDSLVKTLIADGVPFVKFNQWWVPTVEFIGGIAILIGLYSPLAAGALIIICLVATCIDFIPNLSARYAPLNKFDWLDDLLYAPEVLYLVMLIGLILVGPGKYSVDHFIYG